MNKEWIKKGGEWGNCINFNIERLNTLKGFLVEIIK